uniref:Uncharacterized protein n=1 Tax=Panagrellus redivivus TaxID=6233 RepID=A0A7E4UYI8_PANRE
MLVKLSESFVLTSLLYTLHILATASGIVFLFINCCFKRSQKSTNQKATPAATAVGDDLATAVPKPDEIVKTDRTQEETDLTQEISQVEPNDTNPAPEISPYPFEIINKGYGIHKKKRPPWAPQVGESHKKRRTRRKSKRNAIAPTPKATNEAESIQQPSKLPPETPRMAESKPIEDPAKGNSGTAPKSLHKASIEIAGVEPTQDSIASTQPSNLTPPPDPVGANLPIATG